ncbi:hypothetical protein AGABI2DRAFT_133211 [Agaricus bisporus var. bisporus H97]|uniref:hypothetical protein n=1 Tax=Agaricus bisporus var. bisporus (strain H97 / ATCC MYA-4626 / FGSC 10389) TaxID=936046 RepID=UPI00029F72AF|nr:hypothetical protein AGABI2DRAFT_133211 [Agaricus bisporus var. bisporus H97]EKV51548.1 hypothetical protein AGABI2DRAFT_133211 [Agaricus bisporus var. bisporus H97]
MIASIIFGKFVGETSGGRWWTFIICVGIRIVEIYARCSNRLGRIRGIGLAGKSYGG